MIAIEINRQRLQGIRLLLQFCIQLVPNAEITRLMIIMRFGPVSQQHEVKADKHLET